MHEPTDTGARLVLLIDTDAATRTAVRPLLAPYGLELIQARAGVAALELLQRMPDRFRLVLLSMEMPGLPGAVLIETLRLLRPDLAIMCLTADRATVAGGGDNCLLKPLRAEELRSQIEMALAGGDLGLPAATVAADAVARARASYVATGNLLEAAREIALGMPGEPAGDW